ncbi:MAG: hypothetical protein K2J10_11775, partial [Muribaculaceae bacterium]|nr:hypothetical protein [Muribaculaceae bacterium]
MKNFSLIILHFSFLTHHSSFMKITFSSASLLDDILADSALNAIFNQNSALLTADHRPALLRVASSAAATVAGELAGNLTAYSVTDSEITIEVAETDAHPEALAFHFATAVSFATLRLVAISIGDYRRADAYKGCLADTLSLSLI